MTLDPYATHVPVLRLLSKLLTVRTVLECGGGTYSTVKFLDRAVFPDLERLDCIERDPMWAQRLAALGNGRLVVHEAPLNQPDPLQVAPFKAYDLILIDDGSGPPPDPRRIQTLEVIARARPTAVVVLHDYEYYQAPAGEFEHRWVYDHLTPQTAVLWFGDRLELEALVV